MKRKVQILTRIIAINNSIKFIKRQIETVHLSGEETVQRLDKLSKELDHLHGMVELEYES